MTFSGLSHEKKSRRIISKSNLDKPVQELTIADERPPLLLFPVHVLKAVLGGAGLPTQEDNHAVRLGGYEAQHENVSGQIEQFIEKKIK